MDAALCSIVSRRGEVIGTVYIVPALVFLLETTLAAVVIPRWEEMRSALGPHPLGRVRDSRR